MGRPRMEEPMQQTAFRLPLELHQRLKDAARSTSRPFGEEIRRRLESTFKEDHQLPGEWTKSNQVEWSKIKDAVALLGLRPVMHLLEKELEKWN